MKRENDIPIIYLFVYKKIKERNRGKTIKISDLRTIIKTNFREAKRLIPSFIFYPFLEEMEKFQLIKKVNRDNYEILPNNCPKLRKLEQSLPFLS
jgi:hypothetical protein